MRKKEISKENKEMKKSGKLIILESIRDHVHKLVRTRAISKESISVMTALGGCCKLH